MKLRHYLAVLCLGLFSSIAAAHHSVANFDFDLSKRLTITGTVTYWSFSNPHSFIDVDVSDNSGNLTSYKVFLTSRVALQRFGWRPTSLKPGDIIEIEGSPDRSKPEEIFLQRIVLPDGKVWSHDDLSL